MLREMSMYDFIRGPLVWVAFLVFILGTVYQVYRFYQLSRPKDRYLLRVPFGKPPKDPDEPPDEPPLSWWQQMRLSVVGINPIMISVTTVFHLALVLTPFFVLGHNVLLDLAWHASLPSLPEAVADGLTAVVIAGGIFFLLRRLFLARVRAISTPYDFLVLLIATAPFITGFLAYHHLFDYDTVIVLHILAGEIMLMAVPFTKLVHMPYFFINRFVLVHENTLGAGGNRTWR
jgi:nitrate reductase gamma subunit